MIQPYMTKAPKAIWAQLNIADEAIVAWDKAREWGLLPKDLEVKKGETLFPRIDIKKELAELEAAIKAAAAESVVNKMKEEPKEEEAEVEHKETITIDDFDKIELRTGTVLQCEKVEGSKKLLKSQIKIGNEVRQILSGIAKYYTPEEMVGKNGVVVTNLAPRKMMGFESHGMVLCASDDKGNLTVVTPEKAIDSGSEVC